MSLEEPSLFEKLKEVVIAIIPFEFRIGGWDSERLADEKRKVGAVVMLRAREGRNNRRDIKKLRRLNEELQKKSIPEYKSFGSKQFVEKS